MKLQYLVVALIILTVFTSCNNPSGRKNNDNKGKVDTVKDDQSAEAKNAKLGTGPYFGLQFDTAKALTVPAMLTNVAEANEFTTTVEGQVDEVCQAQGCWLKLKRPEGQPVLVKMKGHQFFVPKDIAGKTVIVHGVASRDSVSVDELRDHAKDAGKSKEEIAAITKPEFKVVFQADGVYLKN